MDDKGHLLLKYFMKNLLFKFFFPFSIKVTSFFFSKWIINKYPKCIFLTFVFIGVFVAFLRSNIILLKGTVMAPINKSNHKKLRSIKWITTQGKGKWKEISEMKSLDRRKKNSTADFAKQTDTQMGE